MKFKPHEKLTPAKLKDRIGFRKERSKGNFSARRYNFYRPSLAASYDYRMFLVQMGVTRSDLPPIDATCDADFY